MEFSSVRAGDAERMAAVDQINEQHALGRLDVTEADVRVTAALAAQTLGELHLLTSDLPRKTGAVVPRGRGGWWDKHGVRVAFPAFCLAAGTVATVGATDSLVVGGIALTAGICGVVLGRFSKGES
ncbi:MAG: DUF1707 domain-containing protein [Nocardioidaceae bacterium]